MSGRQNRSPETLRAEKHDDAMRDRLDEKITAVFHDVSVPDGLADRLLGGLAAARHQARRRRWIVGGLLSGIAAGLLLAVWSFPPGKPRFSAEYAAGEAIQAFSASAESDGFLPPDRAPPTQYPVSRWVLGGRDADWKPFDNFLGGRGVVYRLAGPARANALLYVVENDQVEDAADLPAAHPFSTAGCCASAWREGGLLYVLVVEGDRADYERFLNRPHGPVA